MSNIEAKFKKYLNSLRISRKARKLNLRLFSDFHTFLKLSGEPIKSDQKQIYSFHRLKRFKNTFKNMFPHDKNYDEFATYLSSFIAHSEVNSTNVNGKDNIKDYHKLLKSYLDYLGKKKFSSSTIRNYKSDIQQFLTFAETELKDFNISKDIIDRFMEFQENSVGVMPSSLNRKLSSINSFRKWIMKKIIPSKNIVNISEIKPKPESPDSTLSHLQQSASKNSITEFFNFTSSIKWIFTIFITSLLSLSIGIGLYQQLFIQPSQPMAIANQTARPSRILNFQGRLTDNSGSPIVNKTQLRFRIWDQATGGNNLYDSGYCPLSPDQNGIFYTLIGSNCGTEISSDVFSENTSAFLGITAGTDQEMSPRQQIASVGYALNSEKLQGLGPESPAGISTIPFIDENGRLIISASSPLIKSTAGQFSIEGVNLLLSTVTGSNGSISLKPDQNGTVNLDFSGFIPASGSGLLNLKAPNLISNSLISAAGSSLTAGYNLLELLSGDPSTVKFSVDATGNTNIAGDLKISNIFEASASGILINSPLTISGLINDGGLGFFSSKGNALPVSFDFTKDTTVEFDFKSGTGKIIIDANINSEGSKFYRFNWDTDGSMKIEKCTGTCTDLASSSLTWTNNSWHHGYIRFISDTIRFDLDNNSARVNTNIQTDIPKISNGWMRFTSGLAAINNLRISPNSNIILTSGDAKAGGKIEAGDHILSGGQLRTGSYSSAPSNAGNGALYFNTSDNQLYFWNGSNWIATGNSGDLMVSGDLFIDSGRFYPSTTSNHEDQESYFIVADTTGTGSILTNASSFSSGGTDFAEVFDSSDNLEIGDLVEIAEGSDLAANLPKVRRTQTNQSQKMIGFVTDRAGFIGGKQENNEDISLKTVGLVGRVPAKVSALNGPIQIGDPLTSSVVPGHAVKALNKGPVIGRALEDFTNQTGIILVFVQYSWFDPGSPTPDNDRDNFISFDILSGAIDEAFSQFSQALSFARSNLEYLIVGNLKAQTINSPVIEAENITTSNLTAGTIEPFPEQDLVIDLASGSGQLKIKGPNEELLTLNTQGDLDLSGDLTAKNSSLSGSATVSGTLFADDIKSSKLDNLNNSFGQLNERLSQFESSASASTTPAPPSISAPGWDISVTPALPAEKITPTDAIADQHAQIISDTHQNTASLLSLYERVSAYIASSSAQIAAVTLPSDNLIGVEEDITLSERALNSLKVTGTSSLADTTVAGQLMVDGQLVMESSQLASLSDFLYLTSQKAIDLMGGQVVVDREGNLTVRGQILAEKGIVTKEIYAQNDNLTIKLDQTPSSSEAGRIGGAGTLIVEGNASVAGTLSTAKLDLSVEEGTSGKTLLTAVDNFLQNGINTPGVYSKGSIGADYLPANNIEITVFNDNLTDKTLIYLTPASDTEGKSLYLAGKETCPSAKPGLNNPACKKYFKVALNEAINSDLYFNWWLVN
ncbi:MAG: hypothetical protein UV73_C0005G0097 [Candidatus Gottesmanbacteria bacterium GW2011_GWA2_43_14]|uniref:Core-binding (CB) domain-containing protein n=1 Tax=Candidatus Gottesmanbacteria bacterium GW2011_GWA2_43_14 TaxID=1618443 RepID=A0A0G1DIZ6_9BACT|nr:MAG: hypothetical protein UV73_C0005G0097 [Candidatus Gottesmanbacteria bacterium GW2011_GWA2_43_14]